ncbi:hypothetical protein D3C81_1514230 [compost metagenome]
MVILERAFSILCKWRASTVPDISSCESALACLIPRIKAASAGINAMISPRKCEDEATLISPTLCNIVPLLGCHIDIARQPEQTSTSIARFKVRVGLL